MIFKDFINKTNQQICKNLSDGMAVYIRYAWFSDFEAEFVQIFVPFFDDKGALV